MSSGRERILSIIMDDDKDSLNFSEFVEEATLKNSTLNFSDQIELLSAKENELFYTKLGDTINSCIDSIFKWESNGSIIITKSLKLLQSSCEMILVCLNTSIPRPASLLRCVQSLHDILITLDDTINRNKYQTSFIQLRTMIARICEQWWIQKEPFGERLITQLIPYLLLVALRPTAYESDIKRIYKIHSAFTLLDYEDNSIRSIHMLILKCVENHLFLKCHEGKKFISYLFGVHISLHQDIINTMKQQLYNSHQIKLMPSAYGDILYNAWKHMVENSPEKSSIEDALQTLVHEAIHAPTSNYFCALRVVLNTFHDAKRYKGVDTMLLRVYGPILWRSLRCANAIVRVQATMIFFDSFPLQNEDASAEESDSILQKQFDLLTSMLRDDDHRVRCAAATGVCHVLKEFWIALPPTTTKQTLSYVVGSLGRDSSCANVRVAVMTGLKDLLEQPLSHNVLKSILPILSNTIHDYSDRVRVAFIQILCKVKQIKGMVFYNIVSVDHLLARLQADSQKSYICSMMTKLLLNSFLPPSYIHKQDIQQKWIQLSQLVQETKKTQNKTKQSKEKTNLSTLTDMTTNNIILNLVHATDNTENGSENTMELLMIEPCRRCIEFIKKNETAAIGFYSCIAQHVSIHITIQLLLSLYSMISYHIDISYHHYVTKSNSDDSYSENTDVGNKIKDNIKINKKKTSTSNVTSTGDITNQKRLRDHTQSVDDESLENRLDNLSMNPPPIHYMLPYLLESPQLYVIILRIIHVILTSIQKKMSTKITLEIKEILYYICSRQHIGTMIYQVNEIFKNQMTHKALPDGNNNITSTSTSENTGEYIEKSIEITSYLLKIVAMIQSLCHDQVNDKLTDKSNKIGTDTSLNDTVVSVPETLTCMKLIQQFDNLVTHYLSMSSTNHTTNDNNNNNNTPSSVNSTVLVTTLMNKEHIALLSSQAKAVVESAIAFQETDILLDIIYDQVSTLSLTPTTTMTTSTSILCTPIDTNIHPQISSNEVQSNDINSLSAHMRTTRSRKRKGRETDSLISLTQSTKSSSDSTTTTNTITTNIATATITSTVMSTIHEEGNKNKISIQLYACLELLASFISMISSSEMLDQHVKKFQDIFTLLLNYIREKNNSIDGNISKTLSADTGVMDTKMMTYCIRLYWILLSKYYIYDNIKSDATTSASTNSITMDNIFTLKSALSWYTSLSISSTDVLSYFHEGFSTIHDMIFLQKHNEDWTIVLEQLFSLYSNHMMKINENFLSIHKDVKDNDDDDVVTVMNITSSIKDKTQEKTSLYPVEIWNKTIQSSIIIIHRLSTLIYSGNKYSIDKNITLQRLQDIELYHTNTYITSMTIYEKIINTLSIILSHLITMTERNRQRQRIMKLKFCVNMTTIECKTDNNDDNNDADNDDDNTIKKDLIVVLLMNMMIYYFQHSIVCENTSLHTQIINQSVLYLMYSKDIVSIDMADDTPVHLSADSSFISISTRLGHMNTLWGQILSTLLTLPYPDTNMASDKTVSTHQENNKTAVAVTPLASHYIVFINMISTRLVDEINTLINSHSSDTHKKDDTDNIYDIQMIYVLLTIYDNLVYKSPFGQYFKEVRETKKTSSTVSHSPMSSRHVQKTVSSYDDLIEKTIQEKWTNITQTLERLKQTTSDCNSEEKREKLQSVIDIMSTILHVHQLS